MITRQQESVEAMTNEAMTNENETAGKCEN